MLNQHDINPPVKHRLDGDRMGKSYRDQIAKYSKSAHFGLGGVEGARVSTHNAYYGPKDSQGHKKTDLAANIQNMKASHFTIGGQQAVVQPNI